MYSTFRRRAVWYVFFGDFILFGFGLADKVTCLALLKDKHLIRIDQFTRLFLQKVTALLAYLAMCFASLFLGLLAPMTSLLASGHRLMCLL